MVELDDKELLELYRLGQKERMFNELVGRYQKRIYWVVRRMVKRHEDADDIAQDVFVKAYTALEGFRGDSDIYTWLYRIAVNLSINHLRKQKVRNAVDLDDYLPFLSRDADQDKKMMRRENVSFIEEAMERLPEKQRAVFIMRYYEEMPYEQISSILGTSVGGLKANFHHAVKKVAAYVKENHGSLNLEDVEGIADNEDEL
ncbi:MAG: sigma-70 family RNA polymerase sigma factor [Chlorobi bacterium]|nr:sigma-70 family RNA polymerase sigma factor [Chlorobiota bacterium]